MWFISQNTDVQTCFRNRYCVSNKVHLLGIIVVRNLFIPDCEYLYSHLSGPRSPIFGLYKAYQVSGWKKCGGLQMTPNSLPSISLTGGDYFSSCLFQDGPMICFDEWNVAEETNFWCLGPRVLHLQLSLPGEKGEYTKTWYEKVQASHAAIKRCWGARYVYGDFWNF